MQLVWKEHIDSKLYMSSPSLLLLLLLIVLLPPPQLLPNTPNSCGTAVKTPRIIIRRICTLTCNPLCSHPIPHSSGLLHQLPQQPNFALNRSALGDNTLQRADVLDVGCEVWLSLMQLHLEVAKGGKSWWWRCQCIQRVVRVRNWWLDGKGSGKVNCAARQQLGQRYH